MVDGMGLAGPKPLWTAGVEEVEREGGAAAPGLGRPMEVSIPNHGIFVVQFHKFIFQGIVGK